ncbi:Ribonuclease 3-like protein 3 [Vitis vinifera]|uniref:Ribonuclease 3-like protein 3 n=1 Tax=Vitis vinifera TaxID=29760 RepID=A0A438DTS0_VITVI|nr:Ribonuclease 3-like protein 3 [Vitis vinifera]
MEPHPQKPRGEGETESCADSHESAESFPSLEGVEQILGYSFTNKSSESADNKEQFFLYPDLQPGRLTRLRSANVDKEKLARVALKHGLHRFLRHKKPKIEQQIYEFAEAIKEYPLHSNGQIEVPKVLADVVESTIGAVFVDCNCSVDTVSKVFKGLLEPMIVPETLKVHPVTELNERCQKRGLKLEFKDSWQRRGDIDFYIEDYFAGRGEYPLRKDIALNRAAKAALNNIDRILKNVENPTLMMKLRSRWRKVLKFVYG